MSTVSSFKNLEKKAWYTSCLHSAKDCMKNFCKSRREHAIKIINFEKKKIELLTNEQQESHENAKIYDIYQENLKLNIWR